MGSCITCREIVFLVHKKHKNKAQEEEIGHTHNAKKNLRIQVLHNIDLHIFAW